MKRYGHIGWIMLFIIGTAPVFSQTKSSPYVETLTGIINNQGFGSNSLRSSAISRPVPIHLSSDATNRTVSPRFVVGKTDYLASPNSTWAGACGWTTAANNSSSSAGVIASPATGCHGYSELGSSAGSWRLPTQRELMIIYLMRKELLTSLSGFVDFVIDGTPYWSSSAYSDAEAWSMDFKTGTMTNKGKTSRLRVRCVRDL